jgi:hypothetical protein
MSAILMQRYNFFQLGIDWEDGNPVRLTRKQIYYRGTCTFITDEMYVRHPQKSLDLIEHSTKRNKLAKDKASRTWSIYGRPKLAEFLMEVLLARQVEDDAATHNA